MVIRAINSVEFNRPDIRPTSIRAAHKSTQNAHEMTEKTFTNLQDEMNSVAEEMADILQTFGRFCKAGRRNDSAENDFVSSMLEDKADEKLGVLIKKVNQLKDSTNILNFSRSLFPNDSDLMLALRELLLSRQLSELQKKKIKESISDLEKFCDSKKMHSGINIGHLAKRFSDAKGEKTLSAKELRNSYLRFLELDLPASFIYQDWVDEFGFHNRSRLLCFTLSALVSDMKANVPGIHFDEFGTLSSKLCDARILNTIDHSLIESFNDLNFSEKLKCADEKLCDSYIFDLFMVGLTDTSNFERRLLRFNNKFMSELLISQRATAVQTLQNVYNITPEFLYANPPSHIYIQDFMSSLMLSIYEKEQKIITGEID